MMGFGFALGDLAAHRRPGAQVQVNHIAYSEDFQAGWWSDYWAKPAFTTGIADPLGGTAAMRFNTSTTTASPNGGSGGIIAFGAPPLADFDQVTVSIWARASVGCSAHLGLSDQSLSSIDLTPTWTRFSHTGTYRTSTGLGGVDNRLFQFFEDIAGNPSIEVDLFGAQAVIGGGMGTYVATP
ncbi:MAG: hypothetical protein VX083_10435 [Pseudomonadota bacterium]|nr:hypothetical protein [Pseudomonadota bacterium]MEC8293902.1 hypothetical protein [Pseudomonadota bacterium]